MRFINQEEIKPKIREYLASLEEAHTAVMNETDPELRKKLFAKYQSRWTALRGVFEEASHGKCWYVECKNPGTDEDIDHWRPKSRVNGVKNHPGYYWLAFDWTNMRLSCHRANRKRINPETAESSGKSDHFPLLNPEDRAFSETDDLRKERPTLLDPTNPADPALLSFLPNGEVSLSPAFAHSDLARQRLDISRIALHLDWPKFRDDRIMLYNSIARLVERGQREAPVDIDESASCSEAFKDIIRDLIATMKPSSEYSAAAKVYVESFKHIWWIEHIVLAV
ncbi:HNH endonuclease family protein [Streptomyces nigra]|uniref:hypothetical protein n=1 Tax=Streptomyces nigra TaxID=1827580 RepID=UPI00381BAA74